MDVQYDILSVLLSKSLKDVKEVYLCTYLACVIREVPSLYSDSVITQHDITTTT